MASKADLFGDTDSSDDEVVAKSAPAAAAVPTRTTIAESSESEEEEPKKEEAPAEAAPAAAEEKTDAEEKGDEPTPTAEEGNKPAEEPPKEDKNEEKVEASEEVASRDEGGRGEPAEKEASTPRKNAGLFGDDDDSSDDDEFDGGDDIVGRSGGAAKKPAAAAPVADGRSMNEKLGLDSDGEEEGAKPDEEEKKEDEPPKYVPPRRMELQDLSLGDDTKHFNGSSKADVTYHMVKLPNLVGIQPVPYDPKTHDMEGEEQTYRGYVHNMIRWRYKTDDNGEYLRDAKGNPVRESNTRLVKWSDGSYTLHVGKEVLEIDNLDSSVPVDHADPAIAGFAGSNGYVYVSQQASVRPPTKRMTEGPPTEGKEDFTDDEETGEAQPAGTVLECVGPIASRFGLRPSSLTSDAHRNLKLAVQKRNVRRARIAEFVTEVDPEKEKQARIRGKDDLAKSAARKGGARRSGGGGRRRGMTASYLEEDEGDYDGVNLGRLKKARYDDEEEEMDYGDDSDESSEGEGEWMKQKKRKRGALAAAKAAHEKAKAKEEESESEDGEVVFGDDDEDDEEEVGPSKRKVGGSAKKAVLDDDDD